MRHTLDLPPKIVHALHADPEIEQLLTALFARFAAVALPSVPAHALGSLQLEVLDTLAADDGDGWTVAQISTATGRPVNHLNRVLSRLLEYGLAYRWKAQGSGYCYAITPTGRAVLGDGE